MTDVTLYRGNRIDGEWTISQDEIVARFWNAVEGGVSDIATLIETRGLAFAVAAFISSPQPDGLNSTWDVAETNENGLPAGLYDAARAAWPER